MFSKKICFHHKLLFSPFFAKINGYWGNALCQKEEEKSLPKTKKLFMIILLRKPMRPESSCKELRIKSIRAGRANLKDAYARIEKGEVFLHNMHISPYEQGNRYNHDPLRTRKLLLHRKEINKLIGETKESGYSLVPLKIYLKDGFAKVELALAKGKKKYDKREDLKKKEAKRDIERAFRERQKM